MTDIVETKKEFTVRDVINAMQKNGYPQAFGILWEYYGEGDDKKIYACALGQAVLNLIPDTFNNHPYEFDDAYEVVNRSFIWTITRLNDSERWPLNKIVDYLNHVYSGELNTIALRER